MYNVLGSLTKPYMRSNMKEKANYPKKKKKNNNNKIEFFLAFRRKAKRCPSWKCQGSNVVNLPRFNLGDPSLPPLLLRIPWWPAHTFVTKQKSIPLVDEESLSFCALGQARKYGRIRDWAMGIEVGFWYKKIELFLAFRRKAKMAKKSAVGFISICLVVHPQEIVKGFSFWQKNIRPAVPDMCPPTVDVNYVTKNHFDISQVVAESKHKIIT